MAQKRTTKKNMPVIRERKIPAVAKRFGAANGMQPGSKYYKMGVCNIIVSPPTDGAGWHMSISSTKRYQTWDELAHARYELLPDDCLMMMELPPKGEYVNVHENTFHLHEQPDVNGLKVMYGIAQQYHNLVAESHGWHKEDELQKLYDFNDQVEMIFTQTERADDDE